MNILVKKNRVQNFRPGGGGSLLVVIWDRPKHNSYCFNYRVVTLEETRQVLRDSGVFVTSIGGGQVGRHCPDWKFFSAPRHSGARWQEVFIVKNRHDELLNFQILSTFLSFPLIILVTVTQKYFILFPLLFVLYSQAFIIFRLHLHCAHCFFFCSFRMYL